MTRRRNSIFASAAWLITSERAEPPMPAPFSQFDTLIVPGWHGSPAGHWQSIWERAYPGFRRVEQKDWIHADPDTWAASLDSFVASTTKPVVLVAHSLGVLTVAHWAAQSSQVNRVHAAFLVAPPDVEHYDGPADCLSLFAPIPRHRLPFDSLVVGSENDPYASASRVVQLAADWGAEYMCTGPVGHINIASGHGPWPAGEALLIDFLARRQLRLLSRSDHDGNRDIRTIDLPLLRH